MILVVTFACQGHHLGFEARHISGMGRLSQLPQRSWKRADLGFLFPQGLQNQEGGGFCLQLGDTADVLLNLEQEAQLLELEPAQIWPLPTVLEQARQHPCIKALAWHADQPMLLLEPGLLPLL